MFSKIIGLITAVVLGVPIGGVYVSADTPSKYLDRLTTSNSSSEAMEGETPRTAAKAVNVGHGIVLNTVDRNADRLEYVNPGAADGGNDSDAESSPYTVKASSEGNTSGNTVPDGESARSIEWPVGGFTGESTVTYDANGYKFPNGATTNTVTTKYDGYRESTKYAHTDNVDDAGKQTGGYGNNKSYSRVVTIPSASSLTVTITYQTENTNYDWVCAYAGANAGNVNCSASLTGKLGGKTKTTKTFTVTGDSVTFWFKSNPSSSNYYGYYAVVKGMTGSHETVTGNYTIPVDDAGEYKFTGWNTQSNGTGENEVYAPKDITVYAQWELNYEKWGTVGWRITDDGVLKIRPWEGDTGTTGSVTSSSGAPWYNQRSNIKKVESTGTIVLNANSTGLFSGCSNLTDLTGLASWNVSHVTDMNYLFFGCSSLTDLTPLESWNVSNVKDMSRMFYGCSSLTDLTALEHWTVSNVTSMGYMFYQCSSLTDLTPLAHWNVSNVKSMYFMFYGCSSLTDLTGLADWNVSKVTDMGSMFRYCSSLTDLTALANWNVSNVTSISEMFRGCSSLTALTGLSGWNVSKVTDMSSMFYRCSKLTTLAPLAGWNVSNVTDMSGMFFGVQMENLDDLADWDVSKVSQFGRHAQIGNDTYGMFEQCSRLTDITALSNWDVSSAVDMRSMFRKCISLNSLDGLQDWDVSRVQYLGDNYNQDIQLGMFADCQSLTNISAVEKWDTSSVRNLRCLFYLCNKLKNIDALSNWDVSSVEEIDYMLYSCTSLDNINGLAKWNIVKLKSLDSAFYNCSKINNVDALLNWNVSHVTMLRNVFDNCKNITNIDGLAKWDVSNVVQISNLFASCSKLTDMSAISNWRINSQLYCQNNQIFTNTVKKIGIPSVENGGLSFLKKCTDAWWKDHFGSKIITEDLSLGPYTWDELESEMKTNSDIFQDGTVWVKYTPSWILSYDANGGVGSQQGVMVPVHDSVILPEATFLRFGYKFTGWTTQPEPVSDTNPLLRAGESYRPSNTEDGKRYILYAQWEKIGGSEEQPVTGQSGALPGWIQVGSGNTRNDILPNQSQSVVFTNKYDPGLTSIQFRFTKLMDGNVPDGSDPFHFELFSVSENKVIQTTVNNGASVQFDPITYDKPGEYVYYVRESPSITQDNVNANPSIDYDDHLVEVKVTVTEADDATSPSGKKLTTTAQITGDTTFRNDSKPASLDITKTVTGVTEDMNDNHKDREFTFNVNLLDRDNQSVTGKTYPITITNNSGSGESSENTAPSTGSITFDAEGDATVKLKDGSKLTINGIPAYYKYVITETDIPAGYDNTSLTNPSGVLGANSHVTVDAVNQYTVAPASVSLQAGKTLLAPGGLNQAVNNGEFRFTLCQVITSSNEPEPESEAEPNAESCSGVSEASNDGNGLVTFPQLTFDTTGTYTYQIREVRGDTLDMTYDSTVYTATVNVTDDGAGRLVAKVTYTNTSTGDPVTPGSGPGSMGVPVFVNRTTVANRLPVAGGSDIIMAGVILALILASGLFVFLRRDREEQ